MVQRIVSGVAFFAVFLLGLFLPYLRWVPPLIVSVATLWGIWEFSHLGTSRPSRPQLLLAMVGGVALIVDGFFFSLQHALMIIALQTVATIALGLLLEGGDVAAVAGKSVIAPIYVALPLAMIVKLWRDNLIPEAEFPNAGAHYLLFLIIVTWASDTGAYFAGRALGRTKVAPRLSPSKTLEGYLGGIVLTMAVALGARAWWNNMADLFSWTDVVVLGLAFSIIAPLGDLAESGLKRAAEIKDSGRTFTGHGGMLDIIDSLLFTTVFYYVYLALLHPEAFPNG